MLTANWPLLVTHHLLTQSLSKPERADQKAHAVKNALKLNCEVTLFFFNVPVSFLHA